MKDYEIYGTNPKCFYGLPLHPLYFENGDISKTLHIVSSCNNSQLSHIKLLKYHFLLTPKNPKIIENRNLLKGRNDVIFLGKVDKIEISSFHAYQAFFQCFRFHKAPLSRVTVL